MSAELVFRWGATLVAAVVGFFLPSFIDSWIVVVAVSVPVGGVIGLIGALLFKAWEAASGGDHTK